MRLYRVLAVIFVMILGAGIFVSACRNRHVANPTTNAANSPASQGADKLGPRPQDVDSVEQTAPRVDLIGETPPPVGEWRTRAIDLAKAHLEMVSGKPVDATFSVKRYADGYSVHVQYITGRDKSGQPLYIPGGHCGVLISNDWKVTQVLPGA